MGKLFVEANRNLSTTLSIGSWVADATRPRRLKFYSLLFGSEATPADVGIYFVADRCTAAGTSTAVTPRPLDPGDAATESDAGESHTVDPTYSTTAVFAVSCNQRGGFIWTAAPGRELVTPATASNGLGFRTPTLNGGTPAATLGIYAEEQ